MSVESDTARYYLELDRESHIDDAIEREAQVRAEEMRDEAYAWLTDWFGENLAIALLDPDGYGDADTLAAARDATTYFNSRVTDSANEAATRAVCDP